MSHHVNGKAPYQGMRWLAWFTGQRSGVNFLGPSSRQARGCRAVCGAKALERGFSSLGLTQPSQVSMVEAPNLCALLPLCEMGLRHGPRLLVLRAQRGPPDFLAAELPDT